MWPQKGTKVAKDFCVLCAFLWLTPLFSQAVDERIGLRLIAVRTEAEAASLLTQIQSGKSFEAVAKAHSVDSSAKDGGFMGLFRLTDLNAELQRAVTALAPGQVSPVTRIGGEFYLLQRLSVEEVAWTGPFNAGLAAFENFRYEEAARNFLEALPHAEKLKPVDHRLEDNLRGLAEAYRLQKKYTEAEPFYRRYLSLHWGGGAPEVSEVLDSFSRLLSLAYFPDSQFAESRKKFHDALGRSALNERLYTAMSVLLFKAQLIPEAETLMERAAQLFPASPNVRYHLAEVYRRGLKHRKALDTLAHLTRNAVDGHQQSVVLQKIGSIHGELGDFTHAASAYMKALEFTPDSVDARLGLGDVYLQQGRNEDALNEYNRALAADAKSAAAQFRVADANLRMGRFADASAAAAKVLALDAGHLKAQYVLATSLVRQSREDGDREVEIYRKREAEARSATDRVRKIVVGNGGAAAALIEGRAEEAAAMFLKLIETFPDSDTAYLNLGTAQSKLGQHKAAVATFRKMLAESVSDSFLVSWSLAQEYRHLGDTETGRAHEVVYLQNVDLALREALESSFE